MHVKMYLMLIDCDVHEEKCDQKSEWENHYYPMIVTIMIFAFALKMILIMGKVARLALSNVLYNF